jgi:hypothetical protein
MSDTATVTLTTLLVHKGIVEPLAKKDSYSESGDDGPECFWIFYEVNYGNLDFLIQLKDAGVAFQSTWGNGSEFGAGTSYCWFNEEGEAFIKDIYESDINPPLPELMALIDQPDKLIQYLQIHAEKVKTPSFENQEEFGKRFLTKKLLSSG